MLGNYLTDVSQGERLYDSTIWTLIGLKYHIWGSQQRILARELLVELEYSVATQGNG